MANAVVWVDIPVTDLERALRFYSAVLGAPLATHGGLGFLPSKSGEVGGCLVASSAGLRDGEGPLVYLNCDGRLEAAVAAAEQNGGTIVDPLRSMAPHGRRAVILDCEGNRVALHDHS